MVREGPSQPRVWPSADLRTCSTRNLERMTGASRECSPGSWQPYQVSNSARFRIAPLLMAALGPCLASVALAFNFPPLTGRVVDQAGIISAQSRNDLEAKLKDLESKSGIQLVVATVKSLEGSDVETYANELFRSWKLGEAKKNNGVLLLVAPTEHKVRIEVGYGLEGTLTDALSSVIISSAIVPRFKANDFTGGIERGVDGILSVLSGDTADWQPKPSVRAEDSPQLSNELAFQRTFLDLVFPFRHFRGLVVDPWCRRYLLGSIHKAWRRHDFFAHRRFVGFFGLERGVWWRGRRIRWRLLWRRRLVGWRRRVGELVMEFTKEDHEAISAAVRKAEKRTDRLRARPLVLGLHICPDPVGECACAPHSMAVDRFYAIDRAADFPAATRGFHLGGFHFLVDAASPRVCAACSTARPSAPGGA